MIKLPSLALSSGAAIVALLAVGCEFRCSTGKSRRATIEKQLADQVGERLDKMVTVSCPEAKPKTTIQCTATIPDGSFQIEVRIAKKSFSFEVRPPVYPSGMIEDAIRKQWQLPANVKADCGERLRQLDAGKTFTCTLSSGNKTQTVYVSTEKGGGYRLSGKPPAAGGTPPPTGDTPPAPTTPTKPPDHAKQ